MIDGEAEDKYQSRNGNRKFSLSWRREGRMGRWDGGEEQEWLEMAVHRWNTPGDCATLTPAQ